MDIYANVWQPLFVKLFVGSPANVRIKIGETTMPWANEEKRSYYKDDKIVAFKIDSRILLDHNGGEYDLVAIEVAKNTEKSKICSDGAKLFREAKAITNLMAKILPDDDTFLRDICSFGIQIGGMSGVIYSLHLVAPTLYVAVYEAALQFPITPSSLSEFGQTLNTLFCLRKLINERGMLVRRHLATIRTIQDVLAQSSNVQKSQGRKSWPNKIFFTPPKGTKIRRLEDLVRPSSSNPMQTILHEIAEGNALEFPGIDFDEDGWGLVEHDGVPKYYNIYLNKFSSSYGGKHAV
ncbi:hypothetical protein BGZ76_001830 [Entomortierella beljakovae]|nr:hypothetical protein BGZ76_001830 [Entomortierella beljakovae]